MIELLQLVLDLVVVEPALLGVVVGGVEHVYRGVEDVLQHEQNHLDLRLILDRLPQQLRLARFANYVVSDGHRLGEFEVPADQVGQVGEVEAEFALVANREPLAGLLVGDLFPFEAGVGAKVTDNLSAPSECPVANLDFPLHQRYNYISHVHSRPVYQASNCQ